MSRVGLAEPVGSHLQVEFDDVTVWDVDDVVTALSGVVCDTGIFVFDVLLPAKTLFKLFVAFSRDFKGDCTKCWTVLWEDCDVLEDWVTSGSPEFDVEDLDANGRAWSDVELDESIAAILWDIFWRWPSAGVEWEAFLPHGETDESEFLDDTNSGLVEAAETLICEVLLDLEHVCVAGFGLCRRGSVESLILLHLLCELGSSVGELQNVGLLGGVEVVAGRMAGCVWRDDEPFVEVVLGFALELVFAERRDELGVTVDNWSCISIMCSPSRIVRFKGAFPDRKSFTWNTKPTALNPWGSLRFINSLNLHDELRTVLEQMNVTERYTPCYVDTGVGTFISSRNRQNDISFFFLGGGVPEIIVCTLLVLAMTSENFSLFK